MTDGDTMMLTVQQAKVLQFIAAYQRSRGGVSPSYKEIAEQMGTSSKSYAYRVVRALIDRGFIYLVGPFGAHRAIRVIKSPVCPLSVEMAATALFDNIIEEHPEDGWVKVSAAALGDLDIALSEAR